MDSPPPGVPGLTDELFFRAVELYLAQAYPAGVPPRVQRLLEAARPGGKLRLGEPAFEIVREMPPGYATDLPPDPAAQLGPPEDGGHRFRFSLRVGRVGFPHLKLCVEPAPDGNGALFTVDTHDRLLIRPPGDPEYDAVQNLIRENNDFKARVERLWETGGVPTFKGYLRRQLLARRR
jgi:hypothetical protein